MPAEEYDARDGASAGEKNLTEWRPNRRGRMRRGGGGRKGAGEGRPEERAPAFLPSCLPASSLRLSLDNAGAECRRSSHSARGAGKSRPEGRLRRTALQCSWRTAGWSMMLMLLKAADLSDSAGCGVAGDGSRLAPPPPPLRSGSFVRYSLAGPLQLLLSRLLLIRPPGSSSLIRLRAPTDHSSGIRNRPPHFSGLGKNRCALVGITHAFPSKPSYAALLSVFRGCRAEHPNGFRAE